MNIARQKGGRHDEGTRLDENANPILPSKGHTKDAEGKGQLLERRALGDIGNLAGAMTSRCTVSKDGLLKCLAVQDNHRINKQVLRADRPISRKFGTNLGNKKITAKAALPQSQAPVAATKEAKVVEKVSEEVSTNWGTKQRRTSNSNKVRDGSVITSSTVVDTALELPAISGTSSRGSNNPQLVERPPNVGPTVRSAKKTTFTSQLTSLTKVAYKELEKVGEVIDNHYPDIHNQLALVDYVEDIYSFYRRNEIQSCVAPNYMANQDDVNYKMRAILMDWLIEVHFKFELMPETLFLTINLIDRYLCQQRVSRRLLQLVGITAMLVAAKYEEIWAPQVDDFVYISDGAYTKKQVLFMEKAILNTLQFKLAVPTPYVFMVRFLQASHANAQMEMVAWYIIELCFQEYGMLKFSPSMLAAAAVYSANHVLRCRPCWTTSLHHHSGYCEAQLKECAYKMIGFHAKANNNSLGVVYRKYSTSKFLSVAKMAPPTYSPTDCLSQS